VSDMWGVWGLTNREEVLWAGFMSFVSTCTSDCMFS
jgi:hypothetical protein